jgi:hypothetical protein
LTLSARVDGTPRDTHSISAEGVFSWAALSTLREAEALITAEPLTTGPDVLINPTVTVVINVVTLLWRRRSTGPTLIAHALVNHAITVIVDEVTDLRL